MAAQLHNHSKQPWERERVGARESLRKSQKKRQRRECEREREGGRQGGEKEYQILFHFFRHSLLLYKTKERKNGKKKIKKRRANLVSKRNSITVRKISSLKNRQFKENDLLNRKHLMIVPNYFTTTCLEICPAMKNNKKISPTCGEQMYCVESQYQHFFFPEENWWHYKQL